MYDPGKKKWWPRRPSSNSSPTQPNQEFTAQGIVARSPQHIESQGRSSLEPFGFCSSALETRKSKNLPVLVGAWLAAALSSSFHDRSRSRQPSLALGVDGESATTDGRPSLRLFNPAEVTYDKPQILSQNYSNILCSLNGPIYNREMHVSFFLIFSEKGNLLAFWQSRY